MSLFSKQVELHKLLPDDISQFASELTEVMFSAMQSGTNKGLSIAWKDIDDSLKLSIKAACQEKILQHYIENKNIRVNPKDLFGVLEKLMLPSLVSNLMNEEILPRSEKLKDAWNNYCHGILSRDSVQYQVIEEMWSSIFTKTQYRLNASLTDFAPEPLGCLAALVAPFGPFMRKDNN